MHTHSVGSAERKHQPGFSLLLSENGFPPTLRRGDIVFFFDYLFFPLNRTKVTTTGYYEKNDRTKYSKEKAGC